MEVTGDISQRCSQECVMHSILFKQFLNDIVLFIKNSHTNYADDNTTLIDFPKTSQEVISHLSQEGEVCLDWFFRNGMQANPTKFQLMMNDHKSTRLKPETTFTLQSTTLENKDCQISRNQIRQIFHFRRTSLKCMQKNWSIIECIKMTHLYT